MVRALRNGVGIVCASTPGVRPLSATAAMTPTITTSATIPPMMSGRLFLRSGMTGSVVEAGVAAGIEGLASGGGVTGFGGTVADSLGAVTAALRSWGWAGTCSDSWKLRAISPAEEKR